MDDTGAENRLRELLCDQGWFLRPRPDAINRIQNAARRQRIKAASTAAGTAAVIASAAIAVPLAYSGSPATQTPSAPAPSAPAPSVHSSTPSKTHRVMPQLVGLSLQEAEAIISKAIPGVHVHVQHAKAGARVEIVVQEIPAGGSNVDRGATIVIVVSGR